MQAQTVSVTARGETAPVGTANDDAADDPAVWRNAARPSQSLIVATDKKAGLYVYGLNGKVRSFIPAGRVNNVALVDLGRSGVIVVASDRNNEAAARLQLYRLDTRRALLVPLGDVDGGAGEAYGVCLLQQGRGFDAFSVLKHGSIVHTRITFPGGKPEARTLRTLKLATQTEGCVVDPRGAVLYVGEEDRGIWAFDARDIGSSEGRLIGPVDGQHLVADVEGLALWPQGKRGGWLVASSQGDNAYALYRLPGMEPAGRFRITAGMFGGTEETDGIELAKGSFGRYFPGGLFIAQDGQNAPAAQNFKLVSWRDVMKQIKDSQRTKPQ
ncbi:phytase [Novosphingobium sp.]|uniref:phytase n=1 Tax=Novosphingobium sp. TaxID=1874826 RepID=UPI00286E1C2E|nr:phytase [Novosphingobium sp.]